MTHYHHQAKRPYGGSQPHITSYFPQSTSQLSLAQPHFYSITQPQAPQPQSSEEKTPTLPPTIQSNLLAVGMRVRKSVPEGYKTGSEYSPFSLFTSTTLNPAPQPAQTLDTPKKTTTKTRPRSNAGPGSRELLPFSGLLSVGGLNTQQQAWGIYQHSSTAHSWSRYGDGNSTSSSSSVFDDDEVPFLSQGSSNVSPPATPNGTKRRCGWDDSGDDIDEAIDEARGEFEFDTNMLSERVLAVPRRRKGQAQNVMVVGQQERRIFGDDMDFGEAEFLDHAILQNNEVEMTDV